MTDSYAAYCVLDSDGEITEDIAGLYACDVWNLSYRGIGVAASLLTRPIDGVVTRAVEHEKVVERLMRTHTVLPMRFPTVFGSRQAVLAMLERHYSGFRDDLQRLRNQEEFGVRVVRATAGLDCGLRISDFGFAPPGEPAIRNSQPPIQPGGFPSPEAPGRLFMQERYRRHRHRQEMSEQAAQFGRKLDAALSEFAGERHLRNPSADHFVFDGVYLVDRSRRADFHRAFADVRSSEPCFRYLFSGPWPPYNFVTMPALETTQSAGGAVAAAPAGCPRWVEGGAGI